MGSKRRSFYANRVGKRSNGRRGFQGLKKQREGDENTVNNVNNDHVNTPSGSSTRNDIDDMSTLTAVNNDNVNSTNTDENRETSNKSTQKMSEAEKIKATAKQRGFNKLSNRSADKIKSNSYFNRKPLHSRKRLFKRNPGYVTAKGYKLIDTSILSSIFTESTCCSRCKTKGLFLEELPNKSGLSESMRIKCKHCNFIKHFQTSQKSQKFHEVNLRSVYASQTIGRTGLVKFCGIMNLPKPVSKRSYNRLQKLLAEKAREITDGMLAKSSKKLFDLTKKNHPEKIVEHENKEYAKVAVSVDGTWMKRGHQSKLGVTFVQSVETGEVLDYSVKSLFCHTCVKKKKVLSGKAFDDWFKGHESDCNVNHKGSSDKMETDGAKEIFLRSMNNNLIYEVFVGDGDSSSFGRVKEACYEKYGELYTITKEECSGHVQKRMGTRLREYKRINKGKKLSDGRSVGGRNRLTDKWIDDLQKYYGQAIRSNVGNKEGMKNAIWAMFDHCITDDTKSLDEQHAKCPKDGWCRYWNDQDNYKPGKRLPNVFRAELEPIFKDLSADALLDRCLLGLTQNQNESINNVLWRFCPKITFIGRSKLELGVSQTVGKFNEGAAFQAEILDKCGFKPGSNAVKAMHLQDYQRTYAAAVKVSDKARITRQKLRSERKRKSEPGKTTYFPGAFGLSATPDIDLGDKCPSKKTKSKNRMVKSSKPTTPPNAPN